MTGIIWLNKVSWGSLITWAMLEICKYTYMYLFITYLQKCNCWIRWKCSDLRISSLYNWEFICFIALNCFGSLLLLWHHSFQQQQAAKNPQINTEHNLFNSKQQVDGHNGAAKQSHCAILSFQFCKDLLHVEQVIMSFILLQNSIVFKFQHSFGSQCSACQGHHLHRIDFQNCS